MAAASLGMRVGIAVVFAAGSMIVIADVLVMQAVKARSGHEGTVQVVALVLPLLMLLLYFGMLRPVARRCWKGEWSTGREVLGVVGLWFLQAPLIALAMWIWCR